jgi:hypothetical protein
MFSCRSLALSLALLSATAAVACAQTPGVIPGTAAPSTGYKIITPVTQPTISPG